MCFTGPANLSRCCCASFRVTVVYVVLSILSLSQLCSDLLSRIATFVLSILCLSQLCSDLLSRIATLRLAPAAGSIRACNSHADSCHRCRHAAAVGPLYFLPCNSHTDAGPRSRHAAAVAPWPLEAPGGPPAGRPAARKFLIEPSM